MVMMPTLMRTPRAWLASPGTLGQLVHHRDIQQRLAAEEHHRQPLRLHAIQLAFDPLRDASRGLERHLVRELVVVAVIALKAVVAGEVALQGREDRDVELRLVAACRGEEAIERLLIRVAARRRGTRCPSGCRAPRASRRRPRRHPPRPSAYRSSSAATSRETTSCASVEVFSRNTSSRASSGTRRLNIEDCMVGKTRTRFCLRCRRTSQRLDCNA